MTRDPPPIVLSERSRRDLPSPPQKLMGFGGGGGGNLEGESDLGFIIDSAQLLFIKCAHARNVVAQNYCRAGTPLQRRVR